MGYFIIAVILVPPLIILISQASGRGVATYRKYKLRRLLKNYPAIFGRDYLDAKAFYLRIFKQVPCITYMRNIQSDKVFEYIIQGNAGRVESVYQMNQFNWQHERVEFTESIFVLENKLMIELGREYVEVLFGNNNFDYAKNLTEMFAGFKLRAKEQEFEINIISLSHGDLELKQLPIKPTALDIDLYYNDDFKTIDTIIKQRLATDNDKGIVLLHGLPGTGKTTYVRHLIGSIKKRVLFVSPGVAGDIMSPAFIDLLIDNPNAVLVIEDAENIIMDRKFSGNNNVSNLLNISDGLLSDCLNVQIICTFNSGLNLVDSALLRKGRLIARYEFGKLDFAKAQKLSEHLGFHQAIVKPMTLAEITNPEARDYVPDKGTAIGFRRTEELVN